MIPTINVSVTENHIRFNFVCRWSRMEQCCLQTGRKWEQRRWKEVLQMAWSWRNGNINIFFWINVMSTLCFGIILLESTIDIIQLLCFCWIYHIMCLHCLFSFMFFGEYNAHSGLILFEVSIILFNWSVCVLKNWIN